VTVLLSFHFDCNNGRTLKIPTRHKVLQLYRTIARKFYTIGLTKSTTNVYVREKFTTKIK
jgi:hypothetical protein